jgi:hypothetical protein
VKEWVKVKGLKVERLDLVQRDNNLMLPGDSRMPRHLMGGAGMGGRRPKIKDTALKHWFGVPCE